MARASRSGREARTNPKKQRYAYAIAVTNENVRANDGHPVANVSSWQCYGSRETKVNNARVGWRRDEYTLDETSGRIVKIYYKQRVDVRRQRVTALRRGLRRGRRRAIEKLEMERVDVREDGHDGAGDTPDG